MRVYNFKSNRQTKGKKPSVLSRLKRLTRKGWKAYGTWIFRAAATLAVLIAFLFVYYSFSLPNPNKLLARDVPESTKIMDRNGQVLYEIHGEVKRTQVNLDQVPQDLQHATIAIEDKDFYNHHGFSITGVIRSALVDIVTGKKSQGGSTITQQFIKNAVLSRDKSFTRKLKEIILSIEVEARFSKADILKLYLNEIPYGRNAYGVEAAAQSYFGKSAKDMDLAQSAYLAALPQAPTYYSPSGPHFDALETRKNVILRAMKDQGYIDDSTYQKAKDEKVAFKEVTNSISAPHFSLYVQDYLASKYGEKTLEQGGLKVYTTLDSGLQKIAEDAVKQGVEKNSKKYGADNAGLIAIDPKTGQILAMVGSKDYFGDSEPAGCKPGKNCLFEPNVNVTVADRQPGSSIKPVAYVTSFKKEFGYSPASPLFDVVTNFGTFGGKNYIPHDYDNGQRGLVSIRSALAGSLNIPAVKILDLVGVDNVIQTARDLGYTTPFADCGLSLVLGGCEVKLIDHVAGFSVFANGGVRNDKTAILKIEDSSGRTLEEYHDNPHTVLDPQAVYELVSIMTDNGARSYIFGANSPLNFGSRPVGCKTGTTQNWHDGWTLCFTPSLAVGVWSGNNDGTLLRAGADGVFVAAPIVHQFITEALKDKPIEKFVEPDGIKHISIDSASGRLPNEFTPPDSVKAEVFADYSAPTNYDNVHVGVKMDSATGQVADELTPPDRIVIQPFTVFHSERPDNPNWENPVIAWALGAGYLYPPNSVQFVPPGSGGGNGISVDITDPQDNAYITKLPFNVSVAAASSAGLARLDMSIDGQLQQSISTEPYIFSVNKKYPDGPHTIAIHAVDSQGKSADTSVTVNFSLDQASNLMMTEPVTGQVMQFPATLSAQSLNNFGPVSFYYQTGSTSKLIGTSDSTSQIGGQYQYSLAWKSPPKAGEYKIYAKTGSGITSNKVTVTVP